MKFVAFNSHEIRVHVLTQLTGGVKVVHHGPEGWQQITRMWRRSVTEWQGAQGLELQIPFIFDQWGYDPRTQKRRVSVEPHIALLERLAGWQAALGRTPIFTIDGRGAVPHDVHQDPTKRWVCGGLDLADDYILNQQDNRCRQSGTLTCIEWIPDQVIQSKNRVPTKRIPHTYKIKKGDTLIKIAVYYYGDPSRWRDLAKLNHIHDPNHLRRGHTIKLPSR